MPHIDYVIKVGGVKKSERAILEVIERHPESIWTTAPKDIQDLSDSAAAPDSPGGSSRPSSPFHIRGGGFALTGTILHTQDSIANYFTPDEKRRYGASTVSLALVELAKSNLIWSFRLYRRTYYASKDSKQMVMDRLFALPPGEREKAGFSDRSDSHRLSAQNVESEPFSHRSVPADFSDPRMSHDFAVFCQTIQPDIDAQKVLVAAEGAARIFSMANVDEWELGHLFDIAGWTRSGSIVQTLRWVARGGSIRWLERVPGRSARYSVTNDGFEQILSLAADVGHRPMYLRSP